MSAGAHAALEESDDRPLLSPARWGGAALTLAMMLVVCRASVSELVRDPFETTPGQRYTPLATGPGVIVVMNLLCLVPPLLVLLKRALTSGEGEGGSESRLARAWGPVTWLGLAVLALVSTAWSSDKFGAALSASSFLAAAGLGWTVAQCVRSWGHLRFVLAVLAGLLLVYGAQGVFYRNVELPELQRTVESTRDALLTERGFTPGSFEAEQFLKRISSGEMIGFGTSPNTYAAMLVMLGVVTAGLLAQGIRQRRDPVLLTTAALGLAVGLYCGIFARSRTSLATPVLAAGLIWAGYLLRRHAAPLRKPLFIAGVAVVALLAVAVIGHGLYHGSLPSASLNFRWRYWVGSTHLFLDHPWGVGWANFGPAYLAYRVPAASEEIRDPHNFLVRFATELGLPGLLLCVGYLLSAAWEATIPPAPPAPGRATREARRCPGVASLSLACVGGMVLNILCSVDFSAAGAFVVTELFKRLMFLGVLVVSAAFALLTSRTDTRPDGRPAWITLWAAQAALAVFLVHNLVDFSLFETGPLCVFSVLVGAVVGLRATLGGRLEAADTRAEPADPETGARLVPRVLAAVGVLAVIGYAAGYFTLVAAPVLEGEAKARAGDELIRTARDEEGKLPINTGRIANAARLYMQAFDRVPWNGDYANRAARAWIATGTNLNEIRAQLDRAHAADPLAVRPILDRARLEVALPPERADVALALASFKKVTELNPTDVSLRLEYATALFQAGRRQEAREQAEKALWYNDRLDATEPKRLRPERLARVREIISALPARSPSAGATRPASQPGE